MRPIVSPRLLAGCLLAFTSIAGCADSDSPTPPDEAPKHQDVLARIARGTSVVEWVHPSNVEPSDGAIVITGRTGDAPIIDMDTAERMRPVELYLALATDDQIPLGLAHLVTPEDRALAADHAALAALRQRTTELAAQIAAQIANTPTTQTRAGSCTATEVATARSVFGQGYTSSSTCGDSTGFQAATRGYLYCNGGDCEYPLGRIDGASCPLNDPCDFAQGTLHSATLRSNTGGNPHWLNSAHRIRGFAYNCQGDGDLTMKLRFGAGGWDSQTPVAVNTYSGVIVWQGANLPASAIAIDLVADGFITYDTPASGSSYQPIEYQISGNAGASDHGIFCSDVQQSLTMSPGSNPSSCGHGFVSWCTGSCGGQCFQ
jgi:hypothetical protein